MSISIIRDQDSPKIAKIKKESPKDISKENTETAARDESVMSPAMKIDIEKSVDRKIYTMSNHFTKNIINNLEVNIDYLATRIFNDLKDELDMEYR